MDITKAEFWDVPNTQGLPTFSYAQLLAQLQQDIGGDTNPFAGQGAKAGRDNFENVNNNSLTTITFTEEVYDDLNMIDLGVDAQRITIPTTDPQISRVLVSLYSSWQNNANGDRDQSATLNGVFGYGENISQSRNVPPVNAGAGALYVYTWPYQVTAGDFITVRVSQSSGVTLGYRCWLTVTVLR